MELLRKSGSPDVTPLQELSCDDIIMTLYWEHFGEEQVVEMNAIAMNLRIT